jgi:ATP-dependent Clp protease ATP-binding subunit ClpC
MSEYMEKFKSTKIIGSPPGYVGHEDGGQLTEKVRRKPYSVVLFDEIEKAHPDIYGILLQIMDEGFITDGQGRKINFKNTLILLTSNVGQRKASDFGTSPGFNTGTNGQEFSKDVIQKELNRTFSPEFLNRLDEIIYFNPLTPKELLQIVDVEIKKLLPRFAEIGYKISISKDLKEHMVHVGYNSKYGARPLKRTIQKYIEDTIAELAIKEQIKKGDKITLSLDSKIQSSKDLPIKFKINN